MATNQYFNLYTTESEQKLLEDLIIESIKIHGLDFEYIPRTPGNTDPIYGEDVLSSFEDHFPIEMYIQSSIGFGGNGDYMTKFGLEIRDTLKLWVARRRFSEEVETAGLSLTRPNEGDLLYFPFTKTLYTIKFVEHQNVFYQTGTLNVYELSVELMEYSHEPIQTGIEDIDQNETDNMYMLDLQLNTGTGTYSVGETVTQGSTASGIVVSYNIASKILRLKTIKGTFKINTGSYTTPIVGGTSAASFTLTSQDMQDLPTDLISDNKTIETDAEDVIDDSETSPFGNF